MSRLHRPERSWCSKGRRGTSGGSRRRRVPCVCGRGEPSATRTGASGRRPVGARRDHRGGGPAAGFAVGGGTQDDGGDQFATGGEIGGEPDGDDGGAVVRDRVHRCAVPSGRCPNKAGSSPQASFNGGAFDVLPGRAQEGGRRGRKAAGASSASGWFLSGGGAGGEELLDGRRRALFLVLVGGSRQRASTDPAADDRPLAGLNGLAIKVPDVGILVLVRRADCRRGRRPRCRAVRFHTRPCLEFRQE